IKVAESTASDLVHLKKIDKSDRENIELEFTVAGDFKLLEDSLKVIFQCEGEKLARNLTRKSPDSPFSIQLKKSDFAYQDLLYDVVLDLQIKPDISEETAKLWAVSYGDEEVAERLIELLEDQNVVHVKKSASYGVKPKIGALPDFRLSTENDIITAINGIGWEKKVTAEGIQRGSDYRIWMVDNNGITGLEKREQGSRIIVKGVLSEGKTYTLRGKRLSDGQTDDLSFKVSVGEPVFKRDQPGPDQVCLGEEMTYDFRLEDIPASRVSVVASGPYFDQPLVFDGPLVTIPGQNNPGTITLDIKVDKNTSSVATFTTRVSGANEPKVVVLGRDCNEITLEIITYCENNPLARIIALSGVQSKIKGKVTKEDNEEHTKVRVRIRKPRNNKTEMNVKMRFEDSFGSRTTWEKRYRYNPGC
ncbi:MAG: hypothetical protein ACE5D7_08900, partial [Fidelibacterota bacterium]